MISSIANTGYAVLRPSPSLRRDSKSQAKDPNIIYEVGSRLHGSHRERSFRLGRPFKEGTIGLAAFYDRMRGSRDLCGDSSIGFAPDMGVMPIMGDVSLKLISKRIGSLHDSDLRCHPEGAPEARISIFSKLCLPSEHTRLVRREIHAAELEKLTVVAKTPEVSGFSENGQSIDGANPGDAA